VLANVLRRLRDGLDRSAIWELARRLPGASPPLAACVGALIAVEALVPAGRAVASGALVNSLSAVLAEGFDSAAGRRFDLALAAVALSFVLQMSIPPWRGRERRAGAPLHGSDLRADHAGHAQSTDRRAPRGPGDPRPDQPRAQRALGRASQRGQRADSAGHDQLRRAGGAYAELYDLQARGYR
jgi:hypothetical protein